MPGGWLDFEDGFKVYPGAMEGLRVAELAERAGIAPSAVRFYERAGLLSPAQRAPNGYRMFDESALEELVFIHRARSIGMSLEDIADLVAAWPVGECRSLQARMRDFLARRISQVREQQAELAAFERQIQAALDRLASRDPGPERCGHGCGCETDLALTADEPALGPVPWGTTLSPDAQDTRSSQWRGLAATAASVDRTTDAVRLVLPADPGTIATVAALCATETAASAQTRFCLDITATQVTLTIRAPGPTGLPGMLVPAGACEPPHRHPVLPRPSGAISQDRAPHGT
jgi:DNA-binding transcriptional MerR regulator